MKVEKLIRKIKIPKYLKEDLEEYFKFVEENNDRGIER